MADETLLSRDRGLGVLLVLLGLGFQFFGLIFLADPGFLALGGFAMLIGLGYFTGFVEMGKYLSADPRRILCIIGYFAGVVLMLKKHLVFGLLISNGCLLMMFRPVAAAVIGVVKALFSLVK